MNAAGEPTEISVTFELTFTVADAGGDDELRELVDHLGELVGMAIAPVIAGGELSASWRRVDG